MEKLVNGVIDLFYASICVTMIGGGVLLLAGEVRLAALKKASQGSTKLSGFTQQMTGTKLPF